MSLELGVGDAPGIPAQRSQRLLMEAAQLPLPKSGFWAEVRRGLSRGWDPAIEEAFQSTQTRERQMVFGVLACMIVTGNAYWLTRELDNLDWLTMTTRLLITVFILASSVGMSPMSQRLFSQFCGEDSEALEDRITQYAITSMVVVSVLRNFQSVAYGQICSPSEQLLLDEHALTCQNSRIHVIMVPYLFACWMAMASVPLCTAVSVLTLNVVVNVTTAALPIFPALLFTTFVTAHVAIQLCSTRDAFIRELRLAKMSLSGGKPCPTFSPSDEGPSTGTISSTTSTMGAGTGSGAECAPMSEQPTPEDVLKWVVEADLQDLVRQTGAHTGWQGPETAFRQPAYNEEFFAISQDPLLMLDPVTGRIEKSSRQLVDMLMVLGNGNTAQGVVMLLFHLKRHIPHSTRSKVYEYVDNLVTTVGGAMHVRVCMLTAVYAGIPKVICSLRDVSAVDRALMAVMHANLSNGNMGNTNLQHANTTGHMGHLQPELMKEPQFTQGPSSDDTQPTRSTAETDTDSGEKSEDGGAVKGVEGSMHTWTWERKRNLTFVTEDPANPAPPTNKAPKWNVVPIKQEERSESPEVVDAEPPVPAMEAVKTDSELKRIWAAV